MNKEIIFDRKERKLELTKEVKLKENIWITYSINYKIYTKIDVTS